MSIYSDKLAQVQVVINCQYSVAQFCTGEDGLAYISGAPSIDDVMSYNSLTTIVCYSPETRHLLNCFFIAGQHSLLFPGNWDVAFSRRGYEPCSLGHRSQTTWSKLIYQAWANNSTSPRYSTKTRHFRKYSCMNLWKKTPSYSPQVRVKYLYFRRIWRILV